jgi:AcrR family transcriptional regulator
LPRGGLGRATDDSLLVVQARTRYREVNAVNLVNGVHALLARYCGHGKANTRHSMGHHMTVTRRERIRAATEHEIRHHARALLVHQGRDAVTLRAIARELGITAPALYRYYSSREALLRQLCDDVCTDLAAELHRELDHVDADDYLAQVFAICRGFRTWALAHPREFTLVFASPPADINDGQQPDQFASVFLGVTGPLIARGVKAPEKVPSDLTDELAPTREALAEAFSAEGIDVPAEALGSSAVYLLLRWWVRLYGHIALEVFGRFPFPVSHADRLFDSLLDELAADIGSGS